MESKAPKLTPKRILRLITLAESANTPQNIQYQNVKKDLTAKFSATSIEPGCSASCDSKSMTNCESSGILDLERIEGFGEGISTENFDTNFSLNKSTAFNPGEMTGRSTGTTEVGIDNAALPVISDANTKKNVTKNDELDELVNRLQLQSCEVADLVRESIANSFHPVESKDLLDAEISFNRENGILPILPSQLNYNMNVTRNINKMSNLDSSTKTEQNSDMSMGSYFQKGSVPLEKIMFRSDSPQYQVESFSNNTNVSDSRNYGQNPGFASINDTIDASARDSLDQVPVRQKAPPALKAPQLQHLHCKPDESALDASMSLSLIAKCLGKDDSQVTPSMLIYEAQHHKSAQNQKSAQNKQNPLTTKDMNLPQPKQKDTFTIERHQQFYEYSNKTTEKPLKKSDYDDIPIKTTSDVTTLKKSGKSDTVSTVASMNTVMMAPCKENKEGKTNKENVELEKDKTKSSSISRSSKTCTTVQENRISTSIGPECSPGQHSKDKIDLSPNTQYRELDKSVNWQELLQQKSLDLAKEAWAEISVTPIEGFVGVTSTTTITITSLSDSWLTASLQLDKTALNDEVNIVLPHFPLLLSPGSSQQLQISVTTLKELKSYVRMIVLLKDTCADVENAQEAILSVNFYLPKIQVLTSEGNSNNISFPAIQEGGSIVKAFVLTSDCPFDLHLSVAIQEGTSMFAVSNVRILKKSEIQGCLSTDYRPIGEEGKVRGQKYKPVKPATKATCILPKGNAIRIMLVCTAPKLSELELSEKKATLNGSLCINIVGANILLKEVDLVATVGVVKLLYKAQGDKLHLTKDRYKLLVTNAGTIAGTWRAVVRTELGGEESKLFQVTPNRLDIHPGVTVAINLCYVGPEDEFNTGVLLLENIHEGKDTEFKLTGGQQKLKIFPIKTTHSELSWFREGKKEVSLKNVTDKRICIKCKIIGDGYIMETSRAAGTDLMLNYAPNECKVLTILFKPVTNMPYKAKLVIMMDNDSDCAKSVRLHGCAGGGAGLRWSRLMTFGDLALVSATRHAPVLLTLHNHSSVPYFYTARLHLNLQYSGAYSRCHLEAAQGVVRAHSSASVCVRCDWPRLEQLAREAGNAAAATLGTVSLLTGAEITRQRILRILKSESLDLKDPSADHLSRLKGNFEGEDPILLNSLEDFNESLKCLEQLKKGIQEMTAQIELPLNMNDEHTILLADETAMDHHTLCD